MNSFNNSQNPTIVLVHGAFAESSSWADVTSELLSQGYPVVAVANPLRGVQSDADYVHSVINSIEGPVVLVGHSYGGMVISNAVNGNPKVQSLVFVAAFAPERGESAVHLSNLYPGSTLGGTISPVPLSGGTDLYIQQDKFRAQFAADVPEDQTKIMAATQRPITEAALNEGSGEPAWKALPSWFILPELDLNIPLAAQRFMAERAGSRETVVVAGASHVVMVSHPSTVADLIMQAATVAIA